MRTKQEPLLLNLFLVTAVVCGGSLGWFVFEFGTYHLVGSVAKTLAILIGSAWVGLMAFATKISDITESPGLTPEEHKRLEIKCAQAVRKIWWLSAANAVAVLVVLIPSALVDGKSPVYEWQIIVAGIVGGFSIYSIALNAFLQEELRVFRSDLRLREREEARQAKYKSLLSDSEKENDNSVAADISKYNRSFDWPIDPSSTPH